MKQDPDWFAEARRLYLEGFGTYEMIGERLGKSKASVSRACKGLKLPISNQKLHWERFRSEGRTTKRKQDRPPTPPSPLPQKTMPVRVPKRMSPEEKSERARQRDLRERQRKSVERRAYIAMMEHRSRTTPDPRDEKIVVNDRGVSLPRLSFLDP